MTTTQAIPAAGEYLRDSGTGEMTPLDGFTSSRLRDRRGGIWATVQRGELIVAPDDGMELVVRRNDEFGDGYSLVPDGVEDEPEVGELFADAANPLRRSRCGGMRPDMITNASRCVIVAIGTRRRRGLPASPSTIDDD